jgi:transposase-like protein
MTPRSFKDTISRITDRVVEEMQAWTSRPLEPIYAAVIVDAINVKVRDGQVANRPVYAAIGVDLEGQKDILGMWFGDGTRSLDPKGTGQTRWATRWKPALNAFAITFADRMPTKIN